MTPPPKPKIPIEEIRNLFEYENLTAKQQAFVEAYIRLDYDATAATLEVYNCNSEASARALSYKVLYSVPVAMIVAIHFGDEPQEAFCKVLWRRLSRGKMSQQEADMFKLYAEVRGYRRAWVGAYPELKHRVITAQKEKHRFAEARKKQVEQEEQTKPARGLLEDFNP